MPTIKKELDDQLNALQEEQQKLKHFIQAHPSNATPQQRNPKAASSKLTNLKKKAKKVAAVAADSLENQVLKATVVKS